MEEELEIHEEIKKRVHECYQRIRDCENELKKIREEECKHIKTEFVNYSWAPGHYRPNTQVCSYCGEIIPYPRQNERFFLDDWINQDISEKKSENNP